VNSARLAQYKGQTIRLTGKVVRMDGDTAVIEASDGGQASRLLGHFMGSIKQDLMQDLLYSSPTGRDQVTPRSKHLRLLRRDPR
jgi:hypothetical protein